MRVRFDPDIRAAEQRSGPPRYFAVHRDGILLAADDGAASFPPDPLPGTRHLLGALGEQPCVAIDYEASPPAGLRPVGLRELHGLVPELDWSLASRAVQIVAWDRQHRFCGRCATPTVPQPGERARRCPACGLSAYPRLSPAIIVLVTRGEREEEALLAWGRRWPTPRFSTVAGFVEVGEGLEEAVHREVREETGIEIRDVSYFGSQPWPFPSQLMVGFRARYASGSIAVQESEIVEARWFSPDDVDEVIAPRGGFSIAGWLIEGWLAQHGRHRDPGQADDAGWAQDRQRSLGQDPSRNGG